MRRVSLWLAALAAPLAAAAVPTRCSVERTVKNRGYLAEYTVELSDTKACAVVCVAATPFLSRASFTSGGLLSVFDVQRVIVRADALAWKLATRAASDDTWVAEVFSIHSAINRSAHLFAEPEEGSFEGVLNQLRGVVERVRFSVTSLLGDVANSTEYRFSPFHTSCFAVKRTSASGGEAINVTFSSRRDGPYAISRNQVDRHALLERRFWRGPALVLLAAVLLFYARRLSESVTFHYASAISISMTLGVVLVLFLVWHRLGKKSSVATVSGILGVFGINYALLDRIQDQLFFIVDVLCKRYWPYVVAYLSFFALLGYFYSFRQPPSSGRG